MYIITRSSEEKAGIIAGVIMQMFNIELNKTTGWC